METLDTVVHTGICGGLSLPDATGLESKGVSKRLQTWGPGVYRIIVEDVIVSSTLALGGQCLASLQAGTIVEVVDVVYRPYEQRLRGRIEDGWISLLNTEDGSHWVSKERTISRSGPRTHSLLNSSDEFRGSSEQIVDMRDLTSKSSVEAPRCFSANEVVNPAVRVHVSGAKPSQQFFSKVGQPVPRIQPPPTIACNLIDLDSPPA